MSGNTLPRKLIIKSTKKLQGVQKMSAKKEGEYLSVLVPSAPDQSFQREEERFAVLVDRNIEKAVERNRLKRIARELVRVNKRNLPAQIVIKIKTSAEGKSFWLVKEDFERLMAKFTQGPSSKINREPDLFSALSQDKAK